MHEHFLGEPAERQELLRVGLVAAQAQSRGQVQPKLVTSLRHDQP